LLAPDRENRCNVVAPRDGDSLFRKGFDAKDFCREFFGGDIFGQA
jgi:hypothetical protein